MSTPARKSDSQQASKVSAQKTNGHKASKLSFAEDGSTSRPSPARDLQQRLHAHYVPHTSEFMTRFVTLFVAFALIGTWLAQTGTQTIV